MCQPFGLTPLELPLTVYAMRPGRPHPRRKHRVSEAHHIPSASEANAVRMERLEGQQNLLAAQVKGSVENMTSMMQSVQMDARSNQKEIREAMQSLAALGVIQQSHENNAIAIDRVDHTVSELGKKLGTWFDEFKRENTATWTEYRTNRDKWRESHEAANAQMKETLTREINLVEKATIRILAWAGGAGALVAVIAAGFLWSLNDRFSRTNADNLETRTTVREAVTELRTATNGNRETLNKIELFLVSGGEARYPTAIIEKKKP